MGYWEDYSYFIKKTEELVGMNPAELLERYKILAQELSGSDIFEWEYEEADNSGNTIYKISKVLDEHSFASNILKKEFESNICIIDKKIISFLKPHVDITKDWKTTFQIDDIDWQKISAQKNHEH